MPHVHAENRHLGAVDEFGGAQYRAVAAQDHDDFGVVRHALAACTPKSGASVLSMMVTSKPAHSQLARRASATTVPVCTAAVVCVTTTALRLAMASSCRFGRTAHYSSRRHRHHSYRCSKRCCFVARRRQRSAESINVRLRHTMAYSRAITVRVPCAARWHAV